jgi:hypothetical protein
VKRLNLDAQASYYLPCPNREMIQRMVRNLIYSYQKLGDTEKVDELNEMIRLFGNNID